jgi:hypothetical protein
MTQGHIYGPQPVAAFYQLAESMFSAGASLGEIRARLIAEGVSSFAVDLISPSLASRARRRVSDQIRA